eukprot:g12471.t1
MEREKIPVRNPRTGKEDYYITPPSQTRLAEECARIRKHQVAWAKAPISYRVEVLLRWANAIEANRKALADAECQDTGRRRLSHISINTFIAGIKAWSKRAPTILAEKAAWESSTMPKVTLKSQLVPHKLLGVISPWNFPVGLSTMDAIPALFAGCAVIIKPSEITPRFIHPMMETIKAVPELANVLTFVVGDGKTGQQIIDLVDIVCFTGSVPTGRKVAEQCARNFIPSFLELGGKDPVVITETADIDRAVTAVLRGGLLATGQICFSIERVYVHEAIHDRFVEKLIEEAKQIELTYPDIEKGDLGPLIFHRQGDVINAQMKDAVAKGANVMLGGEVEILGGGTWMRPTIITDVTHEMLIMTEETFGPVIPVMKFSTNEEAINLANDSIYGLSAAVIAGTENEAAAIGMRINAGGISLQDTTLTKSIFRDAEKTSFNLSGNGGSRMGDASIHRFLLKKAIMTNTAKSVVSIKALSETSWKEA